MFKVMMVLIIITIGWGGGRDKKEKPSTWSRLQTTSPACFIMIMLVMFMLMMVLMVLMGVRRQERARDARHLVETANCLPGLPLPPT